MKFQVTFMLFLKSNDRLIVLRFVCVFTDESAAELLNMYESELRIRKTLYQNIAHAKSHDILMVHSAIWLHQPCVKENAAFILESMLRETGLKD